MELFRIKMTIIIMFIFHFTLIFGTVELQVSEGCRKTMQILNRHNKKHVCVVTQPWFSVCVGLHTSYASLIHFFSWFIIRFYLQRCTKSSSSWSCSAGFKFLWCWMFIIAIIKVNLYCSSAPNCRINKRYSCSFTQRHIYGYYVSNTISERSDIYCLLKYLLFTFFTVTVYKSAHKQQIHQHLTVVSHSLTNRLH